MDNIPVLDMVFFILIVLMLIHGYVKGLIVEVFSWASPILAVLGAVFFHPALAAFIRTKAMADVRYVPEVLAFAVIFIVIVGFLKMLEQVLKDVVSGAKMKGVNKVLGLIFGIIEGVAITVMILFVMKVQPVFNVDRLIGDSIFAQILLPVIEIPLKRGSEVINTALFALPVFRGCLPA